MSGADGPVWSYGELWDRVAQVAATLPAAPGMAFVNCENDLASVVAYLAALDRGLAVALVDRALDPTLRAQLEVPYQPDVVLTGGPGAPSGMPVVEERPGGGTTGEAAGGLLLPTSGTTGSPKFVRLAPMAVAANARAIAAALQLDAGDRPITSLPLHYSYGLSVLNSHLAVGATVVLADPTLMAPGFWDVVRRARCTSMAGVPYSYQILRRLGLDHLDVPSVRVLTQAGGKLADDLIREFHAAMAARGGRLYVMYGQTEATARISVLPSELLPARTGSVGRALPGGSLIIEGDEIVYRGPNVMLGYARSRADLALGDELGGTLHTGDLGRLDDEGLLWVTGRTARFAKVFGLRINLEDVEWAVRDGGAAAAVAGTERVVVYCEFDDGDRFAERRTRLARRFKVHERGLEFRTIGRLPRLPSGKIDYRTLQGDA